MGILEAGAGAAGGLEKVLTRMFEEERLDEARKRSEQDQQIRNRQIDTTAESNRITQAGLAQNRSASQESQLRDDVRSTMALRPVGREVDPKQADFEIQHGAPSDFFLRHAIPDEEAVKEGVPESLAQNDPTKQGVTFLGTAPELKTSKPGNVATPNYKLNGRDIVAQRTPEGRIIYHGDDITDDPGLAPYVAPDRALVPTGNTYDTRANATDKIRKGVTVPLPTTSTTRTMEEGASMLKPHIESVGAQAEALDKAGLFGPIMSRVRDVLSKVGTIDEFNDAIAADPELNRDRMTGRFATSLGLLASGAGRVHGGARGGGSTQMLNYFKSMLSDASTLPMFLGRLDGVDEYMTGYAAGPGGEKTPAATSGAGDAYEEYLKRTR